MGLVRPSRAWLHRAAVACLAAFTAFGLLSPLPAAIASHGSKTDLFVDVNDEACDDEVGDPYCTISAAVADADGGETIFVAAGIYGPFTVGVDVSIVGEDAANTVVSNAFGEGRVVTVEAGLSEVSISGLTISHGVAVEGDTGGGMHVASPTTLDAVIVSDNESSSDGGGISVETELTIIDSIISGNRAAGDGGGIWATEGAGEVVVMTSTIAGNEAEAGGGVAATGASIAIIDTTITANTSEFSGGGIRVTGGTTMTIDGSTIDSNVSLDGDGGGIAMLEADLTVANSTISGNTAPADGGGIFTGQSSPVLRNVTVTANSAGSGGGVATDSSLAAVAKNSIIAGNFAEFGGPDCSGSNVDVESAGYILIGDSSDCDITSAAGDLLDVDAMLGPLAGNGGPTMTHALLPDSPAVEAGSPATPGGEDPTACEDIDQRDVPRPQQEVCDIGAYEASGATITVTVSSDTEETPPGASMVPIEAIAIDALGSQASAPISSVPISSVPISSVPISSVPISSVPISSVPISSVLVDSVPISSVPISSVPISSVNLPCNGATNWEDVLEGTELAGAPVQTVTLEDVLALSPPTECVASLVLGNVDFSSTLMGQLSLAALSFGSRTLDEIPLSDSGAAPIDEWCTFLADAGFDCTAQGITGGSTIAALDIAGAPISSVPISSVPISSVPISSVPISSVPISSVPISSVNVIFDCEAFNCRTFETFGDAFEAGALRAEATFGDYFFGLLEGADFPWEELPLDEIGVQRFDPNAPLVEYAVDFSVTGTNLPLPGTVDVELPEGFLFATGTAQLTVDDGEASETFDVNDPAIEGTTNTFTLPVSIDPFSDHTLTFLAHPGLRLGTFTVDATVAAADAVGSDTDAAPMTVVEAFEPDGDSPDAAPEAPADMLVISHVATEGDTDFYRVPIPETPGARIQLSLSQLNADNDLLIYRPVADQLSAYDESDVTTQIAPVEDPGINGINGQDALSPETIQDIDIQSLPISSVSANRATADEQVATTVTSDEAASDGFYTIQVSGYNGATSSDPYVLRARVVDDVGYPECSSLTLPLDPGPPAPTFDPAAAPAGLNTVFLVNLRRLEGRYGAAEAQQVLADLQNLVDLLNDTSSAPADPELAALGLVAAVVPVEAVVGHDVSGLYETWDEDPCNPDAANDVVGGITSILEAIDGNGTSDLQFITIVGSDEAIPLARVPDLTTLSNQADYAATFPFDTALYGAFASEHILSDDPYGDVDPIPWLGRQLFIPDRAVGRLVETPAEIATAIDLFITNDGQLDPTSSLVTGYDFLTDGAGDVTAALAGALGQAPAGLISDTWTSSDFGNQLLPPGGVTPEVGSLNAHFDHYRLQPADESEGLYTVQQILDNGGANLQNRIFFSMGCNAAVSVPDHYFAPGELIASDWAQVFSRHGAILVGNNGYGYGDTASVALSERLMTLFAERLDGSMAAGEALTFAKQEYVAGLGLYGVYDEKALVEATFYGLPFYSLSGSGAVPPAPDPLTTVPDPETGIDAATIAVSNTQFAEETLTAGVPEDTGSFYEVTSFELTDVAGGGPAEIQTPERKLQVTHYRPIQPRIEIDVTGDGTSGRAHGALLTGLSSTDVEIADAAVSRPVIDLTANERELAFGGTIFPSALQNINTYKTPTGERQRLVLIPGQFFFEQDSEADTGVQRTYGDIEAQVFYSDSDDFDPPFIALTEASVTDDTVDFSITVEEDPDDLPTGDDTVTRVVVLWTDGTDPAWNRVELTDGGGGVWTGSDGPVNGLEMEFMVQALDASGNVGISTNKALFHKANVVAATLAAGEIAEGDTATISVAFNAPAGPITATIDWGDGTVDVFPDATSPLEATHTYRDDGVFVIEVCVTDGADFEECDQTEVTVENAVPVVDAGPDQTLPDTSVPVIVSATFTDPGADEHTAIIDWGDGDSSDGLITGDLVSGSHLYAEEGTYTVTVMVFDDDSVGSDTFEVTIGNQAPEVEVPASDLAVDEGSPAGNSGLFVDPNGDAIVSISADVGDTVDLGEGAWEWSFTPTDGPDELLVTVTAIDSAGNVGTDEFSVSVADVAPVATLEGATETPEGGSYSLDVSVVDPGADTVESVTVDWGDGTVDVGAPGPFEHVYVDGPDEPVITVDLVNEDGTFPEAGTLSVTVFNVAPSATIAVDPASPIDLGTAVSLTSTVIEPGDDTLTYAWEVTDSEGVVVAGGTADSLVFTPLAADVYLATLVVTDSDGDAGEPAEASFEVVGFDEPIIDGLDVAPAGPIPVGTEVTATASFTGTVATATVDWGDGTVEGVTPTSGILQATHSYTEAGLYPVTMTVTGPGGTSDSATFSFVIVAGEPLATRGGGTVSTTLDVPDSTSADQITQFSFSTRFRRTGEAGGTVRLNVLSEDFVFQSSDVSYVVVSGDRADIAATGTLNDLPGYTIHVTAIDGNRPGGDGVDKYRARILLVDEVVFDTEPGADPLATPSGGLLTGGILIGTQVPA